MIYRTIAAFCASALASLSVAKDIGTIGTVTQQTVVQKLDSGSELVALETNPSYENPIYVLSLHGATSLDQGKDAALLFGKQMAENYQNLFDALFGQTPIEPMLQELTEEFMDWQWSDYMSKQVPSEYMDELQGLLEGGESVGIKDLDKIHSRGIVLANLPGDGEDIIYVLLDEFQSTKKLTVEQKALIPRIHKAMSKFGHQCSNFGIWGSRTQGGEIFTARNLDWLPDLGINKYKLLTVHHPPEGYSHVTVGFAAIWGALTGMSSKGLTVHEANLESTQDTFQGFPWLLRLREVMAHSSTIDEGVAIWGATNNTVGFNHMIGSASDHKAVAIETMKGYSAYFYDMDDREVDAVDPQTGEIYGFPMTDAVYRTNHGYDPVTQQYYNWYGYHAYEDSKNRYNDIANRFKQYGADGVLIGPQEAVTVTSAVAIKGDESDEGNCNPDLYADGINILSVTFDPSKLTMYAAFEDGSGADWIPAACNGYIKIDMSQWF